MALAFLLFDHCETDACHFRADIGTNRLYRYVVGRQRTQAQGMERVDDVVYESPFMEAPPTNPLRSEFTFAIPTEQLADRARYVQLVSRADETGRGETRSDVVTADVPFRSPDTLPLPTKHLFQQSMNTSCGCQQNAPASVARSSSVGYVAGGNGLSLGAAPVRQLSYTYQTAPVSRAMFWDAILGAAKLLVPAVVGAVQSGSTGAAPSGGNILQTIMQILGALTAGAPGGGAVSAPAAPAPTVPIPNVPATPAGQNLSGATSWRVRQAYYAGWGNPGCAYGQRPAAVQQRTKPIGRPKPVFGPARYGKAMFIDGGVITGPALIGLLAPLLGPVLQQAPQLLQTVLDSPLKLINAITARKLGQQQLEQNYLSGLLQQVNQRDLMDRLAASGLLTTPSTPALAMSATPSQTIRAEVTLANPITVMGKPKYVFATNQPITLQLRLTGGPTTFSKLIVDLRLKDSRTLRDIATKQFRLRDVPGNEPLALTLSADDLRDVPRHDDVLVEANLRWQTEQGTRTMGTYGNHFIYFTDGYVLSQLGPEQGQPIALNNPTLHRPFWHKVWEGGGDGRRWQLALTAKYLYVYAPTATTNGRLETRLQLTDEAIDDSDRLTLAGKLKTGLEVSPQMLNDLLPALGTYPALTAAQLAAVSTDDLDATMNQEATARLDLRGNRKERGVVWAYPDVVVHQLTLGRVAATDANGQVTQTTPETVAFPRVMACHFLGAKTN